MKSTLLVAIAALLTNLSFAQITEGHVSYRMEILSDEEELDAESLEILKDATLELYFSKDKYRLELNFGPIAEAVTISDGKYMLTLSSSMNTKMAIKMTVEESQAKQGSPPAYEAVATDSTKEILGYTCRKWIVTGTGGKKLDAWTTDKIDVKNLYNPNFLQTGNGFALQYEIFDNEGYGGVFTAIAFTPSLENKEELFNMVIPEGYTELPMEGVETQQENQ